MLYRYFVAPIIGYLFGSIPFAWLVVKLSTGKDIRKDGSGSVSTRNTVRLAGWGWAIFTATLDVTKGFLAVFLTQFYIFPEPEVTIPEFNYNLYLVIALCGLGAFAGHCWMPWMKFTGGKGYAVLTGSLMVLNPWGILIWWGTLPLWIVITRYSSFGAIASTATVSLAFTIFYLTEVTYWHSWPLILFGCGCTLLTTLRWIPDFIKIKKGEIKPWKGLQISQWMR
ncbi:MAG: glycerol-3-phosphate acyltransferase [Asgard group archaeon]|nr:glycerol-3-phosphate acyltransferase [Asgard group archaeon]